ncbi:Nucleic-acid-binding protein [Aphis craccivora]|uniref:Nucleic-acid-binding protein n=1 Tax=Aphis craccivora TaxID=307492 RepID=A0A6G0YPW6_APHCR|nr:Nucleic-acid-binding protein [Aphis craccivora]
MQDACLNISTNNSNASLSSTRNNTISPNNDGWLQRAEKRNLSSSSKPSSPTKITIGHKKLFISRNRFEVLSQTELIDVDIITLNLD